MRQQIWGEVEDYMKAFSGVHCKNAMVKGLLKSVHNSTFTKVITKRQWGRFILTHSIEMSATERLSANLYNKKISHRHLISWSLGHAPPVQKFHQNPFISCWDTLQNIIYAFWKMIRDLWKNPDRYQNLIDWSYLSKKFLSNQLTFEDILFTSWQEMITHTAGQTDTHTHVLK